MIRLMLMAILLVGNTLQAAEPTGKILIIVSNMIDMGDAEKHDARNNLWEVAPPYHVFYSHGFRVDFVSPQGGPVEFSMDPLGISSYTIKYEGFLDKANQSLKPSEVDPSQYQAVFIGGGYGPLFDVGNNKDILSIIAQIYQSGGIIGGCGHGPGAFANVILDTGEFMVKDKRIAGFPNTTERTKSWAKQGSLLPYLVEERLKENGAKTINKSNINHKHDVIIDGRIISTMFLPSAALVAKEMIIQLDSNSPVSRTVDPASQD